MKNIELNIKNNNSIIEVVKKNKKLRNKVYKILFFYIVCILLCYFLCFYFTVEDDKYALFLETLIEITLPFIYFLVTVLRRYSNEVFLIMKEKIIIKKFFLNICYNKKEFLVDEVDEIYFEKNDIFDGNENRIILFLDLVKNLKIKTKIKNNKKNNIYHFGIDLEEEDYTVIKELIKNQQNITGIK